MHLGECDRKRNECIGPSALAGRGLECSRSARMPARLGGEREESVGRGGQRHHGDRSREASMALY